MLMKIMMVMRQEDVPDVLRTVTSRSNEKVRERETGTANNITASKNV